MHHLSKFVFLNVYNVYFRHQSRQADPCTDEGTKAVVACVNQETLLAFKWVVNLEINKSIFLITFINWSLDLRCIWLLIIGKECNVVKCTRCLV